MKRHLLDPSVFEILILKPDVESVITELTNTAYKDEIEKARVQYHGIMCIEVVLRRDFSAAFRKILRFMKGDESEKYIKITLDLGNLTIERFCPDCPTVLYEGKTYHTVQIGAKCWLKENLEVGIYIPGSQNATNNGIIEKYCYNNDPNNCNTYGGLYHWNEAMQYITANAQGICPPGWHIPTLSELLTLKATVNNDGNALKAIGQGIGSGAGTNTSGFSALLAGYRYSNGVFNGLGEGTLFWGSTESATGAYVLSLGSEGSDIYIYSSGKPFG